MSRTVAVAALVALSAVAAPPLAADPGDPNDAASAAGALSGARAADAAGAVAVEDGRVVTWRAGGDGPAARGSGSGGGAVAPVPPDPDLEAGFPVQTYARGGTYRAGPGTGVVVGNLDADADLELCTSALAAGPVYCWHHTGRRLPGWGPDQPVQGVGYAAMGPMTPAQRRSLVVAYYGSEVLAAHDPAGGLLPGWPVAASNYVSNAPNLVRLSPRRSLAVVGEEDWWLHAYRADGTPAPGWPTGGADGGQERHTGAVADVDGVPGPEIFTASGWTSPGVYLFGVHADGTPVDGYPVLFQGDVDTYPAVGDVDGDGEHEVVVVGAELGYPWRSVLMVLTAATGEVEGSRILSGIAPYGTAPALADLDQSCSPSATVEIVVQTEPTIEVVRWDGASFSDYPGFPRTWSTSQWMGDSAPAVGDVDGNGAPDIVFTGQAAGDSINGSVHAYARDGTTLDGFPKHVPIGAGGPPAIADVDRDGRNEIAVRGSPWDGVAGPKPTLWLYDLGGGPHGPVHWGQFQHDGAHTGAYRRTWCP